MHEGDTVIAEHPDSRTKKIIRSYGVVRNITEAGNVIIEMADGSFIKRRFNSIAVFIHPPSNWQELYEQKHVSFAQGKKPMVSQGASRE